MPHTRVRRKAPTIGRPGSRSRSGTPRSPVGACLASSLLGIAGSFLLNARGRGTSSKVRVWTSAFVPVLQFPHRGMHCRDLASPDGSHRTRASPAVSPTATERRHVRQSDRRHHSEDVLNCRAPGRSITGGAMRLIGQPACSLPPPARSRACQCILLICFNARRGVLTLSQYWSPRAVILTGAASRSSRAPRAPPRP